MVQFFFVFFFLNCDQSAGKQTNKQVSVSLSPPMLPVLCGTAALPTLRNTNIIFTLYTAHPAPSNS